MALVPRERSSGSECGSLMWSDTRGEDWNRRMILEGKSMSSDECWSEIVMTSEVRCGRSSGLASATASSRRRGES